MRTYDRQGRPIHNEQEFLKKFADKKYRRVAFSELPGDVSISTVWLGINHQFGHGPPLIFETMIFGGDLNESCWRYSTEEEAREGHEKAVELVKGE